MRFWQDSSAYCGLFYVDLCEFGTQFPVSDCLFCLFETHAAAFARCRCAYEFSVCCAINSFEYEWLFDLYRMTCNACVSFASLISGARYIAIFATCHWICLCEWCLVWKVLKYSLYFSLAFSKNMLGWRGIWACVFLRANIILCASLRLWRRPLACFVQWWYLLWRLFQCVDMRVLTDRVARILIFYTCNLMLFFNCANFCSALAKFLDYFSCVIFR